MFSAAQLLSERPGMKSVSFQILSLKIKCSAALMPFLEQAGSLIHGQISVDVCSKSVV